MANIFGTLTLIVLALAAFVGLKNKNAYTTEIENRKVAEAALKKTETRLATAEKDRDETKAEKEGVLAEIPKVEAQRGDQQKANDELTKAKETKAAEVEANKAKLDLAREKGGNLDNIKGLASRLGSLVTESKDLDDKVSASDAKLASLTQENSRVEGQVAEQRKQVELRSKGESFPTLRTRVSAVYANWGFVTLSSGNTSGVITNSTLDVVRDDEVIAKLLVTAVERNTASASIIPDTVKADITISPGDLVVPGAKVVAPAKPSAASAKPVAAPSR